MKKTALRSITLLTLTVFIAAGEAQAENKDLKKVLEEQGIYVETSKPGIKLSGYVDAGYSYNFTSRNAVQPLRSGNDGANASENGGDFNLNNFKLVLEKPLPEDNSLSAGFRVDLNIGEDAALRVGSNANDGLSALQIQQAYVNFNLPMGRGLEVKVGRFGELTGVESPERPANLNITGGLVASLLPGEHVGLMGTYSLSENWTVNGVIANPAWTTNGDGTEFVTGTNKGNSAILTTGSLEYQNNTKNLTTKWVYVHNPNGGNGILTSPTVAGAGNQVANEGESLLFNHNTFWSPLCCKDKLLLGYNAAFGFYDNYANAPVGVAPREYNESYWGVAGYAKYLFNSVFSLAQRVEYIQSNDGAKFGTVGSALTPTNLNGKNSEALGFTTTAGFNLWENMLLRFEYRADFTHINDSAVTSASRNGDETVAHLAAAQVVYSF